MKNFPVKVNGKEYWISRSVAAVGFVFKKVNNTIYALVEQRGVGAADNIHSYCVACGYIDFDENGRRCIAREMLEECGFKCNINKLSLVSVTTDPRGNKQNISLQYVYKADVNENYDLNSRRGGEENEIEKVEWIPVASVNGDKITFKNDYIKDKTWAFNHDKLIKYYIEHYETLQEIPENIVYD